MKKSERLQRLANLSLTAKQIAAQSLARTNDELERCAAQIRDLERYRDEYLRQLAGECGERLDGYGAQRLRAFVAAIEQALAALADRERQTEARRLQERAAWLERRRRAQTLGDIAARARDGEEADFEKALQREIDDRGRGRGR